MRPAAERNPAKGLPPNPAQCRETAGHDGLWLFGIG